MKRIRVISPVALLLGVLLTAGSATSYVLLSPNRTWNCPPNYTVDQNGISSITDSDGGVSNVIVAITSTTASWNAAGSARIVNAHAGSTAGFTLGDGVPMIRFGDPFSECTGNCLAATYHLYFSERVPGLLTSWKINDADIVTNLGFNWTSQEEDPNGSGCFNEFYIEGVMVHEIGHALGLGHSSASGATMLPSVSSCNNGPATTETDDENAIVALYGAAPCNNSLFQPCLDFTEYLLQGGSDVQPCGGSFSMGGNGTIRGWVEGPDGTDFDLFLDKLVNGSWLQVASATSTSSSDSIVYSATAGTFRFRVTSYSGNGTYHFWYQRPTLFL